VVRWAMPWLCYGIGHAIWLVGDRMPMPGWWYRLYSRFMVWSGYWQGDGGNGPWTPAGEG